jgi:hypothetical protein
VTTDLKGYTQKEINEFHKKYQEVKEVSFAGNKNEERKLLEIFSAIILNYSVPHPKWYLDKFQSKQVVKDTIDLMCQHGVYKQDEIEEFKNSFSFNCHTYAYLGIDKGLEELKLFEQQCKDELCLNNSGEPYLNSKIIESFGSDELVNPELGCVAHTKSLS